MKEAKEKVVNLISKKVYVISGDSKVRETIMEHLLNLGFVPRSITSSSASGDVISRLRINPEGLDLVICHLKEIDKGHGSQTGLQLFRIVKSILHGKKAIPFIFVEEEFEKQDIISAFKVGASHFIVYPTDATAMANKLLEAFKLAEGAQVPNEVTQLLAKGRNLHGKGLFEEAIQCYNKALKIGGENVEVLTGKGDALFEMGNIDEALVYYKKATEIEANFPRAYQGLGAVYKELGNYEEAKANFRKVLELEPENAQVHNHLGQIHLEESDDFKAMTHFEKGIELNKNLVDNYTGLAKVYEAQGNPAGAMKVFKKALEHNPKHKSLYLTAGDFCLKHNMDQEAEEIFDEAISQDDSQIHLYNRMGIALRKQKKYGKAIANFAKSIKIRPDDANLRYNLAKAYYLKGEEEWALEKLQKAFEMDPGLKANILKDRVFSKLMEKYPDKFN